MKKLFILLILLVFPLEVLAYSKAIIPGGETLGIEVSSSGVMVIGFYPINGKYNKGDPTIKSGDYIIKVNNIKINTIKELTNIIEKNIDKKEVDITYLRNGIEKNSKLSLIKEDGIYKTGLYVKDSITGIGTLTYIDPGTHVFGSLGHEITETNTSSIVEIKSGIIFKNYITSIDKSSKGIPGSKNAKFYYNTIYGNIDKNTNVGIFGNYEDTLPNKNLVEVAMPEEVKIGKASIYTVLDKDKIEEFSINITKINETGKIKNITFEIDDDNLINKTGGIVQGMSGSPIIQNNKIIGAVTHVIIDNPLTGYGIFITTMLEEGDK